MRRRFYVFTVMAAALSAGPIALQARADTAPSQEYRIKAAFLYNFLKFVDWPKQIEEDAKSPITIGIIGKDPFGKAFEPVKDKPVKNKKVVIRRFKGYRELKRLGETDKAELHRQVEAIRMCRVLFVCPSEKELLREIVKLVRVHPVLTVGHGRGFLESGGIINFVMEDKKVRFEINAAAAERSGLKIRAQLLRLARKVVKVGETPKNNDK